MSWALQAIWQGHELAKLVTDLHIPGHHRLQLGQGHFDGQLITCVFSVAGTEFFGAEICGNTILDGPSR